MLELSDHGLCNTSWGDENIVTLLGKSEGKRLPEEPGCIDRRIILKLILITSSRTVLTGLHGSVLNQRWTIANQTIGLSLFFKTDTFSCSRATVGSLRTTLFQGLKIITLKSMTRRIMRARALNTRTQGRCSPNMRGAHNSARWLLTGNHAQQPSL